MESSHIFIMQNGDVLELDHNRASITGRVRVGNIMVDGIGVGDVGNISLRDRKHLAEEGMLIIVVAIEKESYTIVAGSDIIIQDFVYAKNTEELIEEVKRVATEELANCLTYQIIEGSVLKIRMKKAIEILLYEKTKRRPTVFPIIVEV